MTTPKYPQFTTPITTTEVTTGIVTGGSSYAGNYEGNSVLIVYLVLQIWQKIYLDLSEKKFEFSSDLIWPCRSL